MFSRAVGREEHCKQISLASVGRAHSVWATLGLPHSQRVYFPSLHCSGSRMLCWELSEAGPGMGALPRPKPLRFRYSGTPQSTPVLTDSVGPAFVPFPGPSSLGDQVLGEHGRPLLEAAAYRFPLPIHSVSGCTTSEPSQVCCVSLSGS